MQREGKGEEGKPVSFKYQFFALKSLALSSANMYVFGQHEKDKLQLSNNLTGAEELAKEEVC